MKAAAIFLSLLALTACSTAPKEIQSTEAEVVTVQQVQNDPEAFVGKTVRWGGSILNVANKKDTTEIQLLSRPLSAAARPLDKPGNGRFMVEVPGFVDPAEYPVGRDLTVVGSVNRIEEKAVGEYPYRYPVLVGATLHLWPERVNRDPYYPYYHDPFFSPPFHRWPYYSPFWHPHPYYW